jgi:methylphosphotriester-DNA--protein-cysteine methyltransferase
MNAITIITLDDEACWSAVLDRDAGSNGAFFCRPCRAQAHFFAVL